MKNITFTENELKDLLGHYLMYRQGIAEGWEESTNQHSKLIDGIIEKLSGGLNEKTI